jgi:hypothetical protein
MFVEVFRIANWDIKIVSDINKCFKEQQRNYYYLIVKLFYFELLRRIS